jgi:hypothetical protein
MNGPIAQTLALVLHGNAFLAGLKEHTFWPDNSVFKFCRSVGFAAPGAGLMPRGFPTVAADPNDWIEGLVGSSGLCVRLEARNDPFISDRMSAGFVGGGTHWFIDEFRGRSVLAWEDRWKVVDPNAADQKIWAVDYVRLDEPRSGSPPNAPDLADMRDVFGLALETMTEFSRRAGTSFTGYFERALAELQSSEPRAAYHEDLAPPPGLLSLTARQLIAASSHAWVFGGMGSWNDGAYDFRFAEEGDRLSDILFKALQHSLAFAANSSLPARGSARPY